ncbi:uncharacterized protein LOC120106293 [Phoenix dactylifera]|uniref:Uncharacterized protein LOC120106293 n=1 Tax=Phoenix dactylifera TaxID=42345 RepID=A0A8B8ZLW6_PHODC|nr:uncharacterized protein LOC120106293 [Phoenix dactylifera]
MDSRSPAEEDSSAVPFSPLHGDERFYARLTSRDSAPIGLSSGVYRRACGRVPFDWETRPGTPKRPTEGEAIPPLSPPPMLQGAQLARRSCRAEATSTPLRFRIWNAVTSHGSKNRRQKKARECMSSRGYWSTTMASNSCFMKPWKLAIFGRVKRWDF